jgi:alanyl-tRNA synthetase
VRRIEATTNINAIDIFKNSYKKLNKIKKTVKANTEDEILEKINQLVETNAKLEKEVKEIALQSLLSSVDEWCDNPKSINDVAILVKRVDEVGKKNLLLLVDRLKNKLQTYVIVVANIVGDRVQLSVFIDKKTSKIISAKTLLNYSLEQIGGKGGGKDDMAQGGGNMESGFENMLANCQKWIDDNLTK